MTEDL